MVLQLIRGTMNTMENNPLGVRKGTWTPEEDSLLRTCIENYGEGKWHLVPLRAGLNRCRKSCRMRWFNYLKPNIKRGQFTEDEVDLIIRLHKLLGNRWTLIAGRLPGRTANDIKNFWNSHIDKKLPTIAGETTKENAQKTITEPNIIRPRPRTFSNCQVPWQRDTRETTKPHIVWTNDENPKNNQLDPSSQTDECITWWSNLLEMAKENMANEKHQTVHCPQEILARSFDDDEDNVVPKGQSDADGLCGFCVDIDAWELLSFGDV